MMNNPDYDDDWDTADLSDIPRPASQPYDVDDDIELADIHISNTAAATTTTAAASRSALPLEQQQEQGGQVRNVVEHDQLPTVEEYKTTAGVTVKQKKKRRKKQGKQQQQQLQSRKGAVGMEDMLQEKSNPVTLILTISVPIVLALVLVLTGIAVGMRSNNNANNNDTSPESSSTHPPAIPRDTLVLQRIVQFGWSREQDVYDPATPQYLAASWIANDALQVPLENTILFRQRYAAAVLYFAWYGDGWDYYLGWLGTKSVCEWNAVFAIDDDGDPLTMQDGAMRIGIICDCPYDESAQQGTGGPSTTTMNDVECLKGSAPVQQILLPTVGVSGMIPPEIRLFYNSTSINLYANGLGGSIPDELTQLSQLQNVQLHHNQLAGALPETMGNLVNCQRLILANNQLEGTFPASMQNMPSLRTLNLNNNNFTGPLSALTMPRLQALFVQNNKLVEDQQNGITQELMTAWANLEVLDLSGNDLGGSLPKNLFASTNLAILDLHHNDFSGTLPEVPEGRYRLGSSTTPLPLQFLALQQNPSMTGTISGTLGEYLLQLQHLDLSRNQFTGYIPPELQNLMQLQYLNLNYNDKLLPKPMPTWLGGLTNLVALNLKNTQRTGAIPTELGQLSKLVLLDLDDNQLDSEIPTELGKCVSLKYALLSRNQLVGGLPDSFQNLGNMSTLLLNDNNLTESVNSICHVEISNPNGLETFYADCMEVLGDCACCTACCSDDDNGMDACMGASTGGETMLVPGTFGEDEDPVWDDAYVRSHYQYHDEVHVKPILIPND